MLGPEQTLAYGDVYLTGPAGLDNVINHDNGAGEYGGIKLFFAGGIGSNGVYVCAWVDHGS